jgi:adenylyltransferase and sulfurtransferase
VGLIGVMQALEVIKIITGSSHESPESQAGDHEQADYQPSMTMFAALDSPQWRTFRLRPKKPNCVACGSKPSITAESIGETNYDMICMRHIPAENQGRISVEVLASWTLHDY